MLRKDFVLILMLAGFVHQLQDYEGIYLAKSTVYIDDVATPDRKVLICSFWYHRQFEENS
jgi:hypothetical protein